MNRLSQAHGADLLETDVPPRPSMASPLVREAGFLGQGWKFPIRPDGRGRLTFSAAEQDVEEAIWVILSTAPGERLMLPEFGCGMHELVFETNSDLIRGTVGGYVREALTRWEPRIDVQLVTVTAPEPNLMLIRIDYRVRATNTMTNLVYPFYITEGGA